MHYLIMQMLILLLATAVIAWLGGRYLCKRGERELRLKTNRLSGKHAALSDQHAKLEAKLKRLKKRAGQMESELTHCDRERAGLEEQLESLASEREDNVARLRKLEGYRNELIQCKEEVVDIQQKLIDERTGHDSALQHAAILEQENEELQQRLDEVGTQTDTLSIQLSELNHKSEDYQGRLHEAMKTHVEMTEEIRALSMERDEFSHKLSALRVERDELQSKLTALTSGKGAEQDVADQANEEIEKLNAQISAVVEERDSYEERLAKLQEQLRSPIFQAPAASSSASAEEVTRLRRETRKLKQELERVTVERNDFLGRLRAISSVVDQLDN